MLQQFPIRRGAAPVRTLFSRHYSAPRTLPLTESVASAQLPSLAQEASELLAHLPKWEEISTRLQHATHSPGLSNLSFSIRELMNAGLHLGHTTNIYHRNMLPFIYGRRADVHIINLEHTIVNLRRAMNVTRDVVRNGGLVLFVGTRAHVQPIVSSAALGCHQFYVNQKWTVGCLSNAKVSLRYSIPSGTNVTATSLAKPSLIINLDMTTNNACLVEAAAVMVPVIGLCDTDCDPQLVTYPIPGNDDSVASVHLVASMLAEAAREGKRLHHSDALFNSGNAKNSTSDRTPPSSHSKPRTPNASSGNTARTSNSSTRKARENVDSSRL